MTTRTRRGKAGHSSKRSIVALVERGGSVRTFHVDRADKETVSKILRKNVRPETRLHTDESPLYREVGKEFAAHEAVLHSIGEYARGDVHTNTAEGFFSVFKRGMKGVYQHCGEQHLQRYLDEFEFRYSNRAAMGISDADRALRAIKGAEGKRLTYQETGPAK